MDKVKCECGHVNPFGTYLCESCGKPLKEEKKTVVDMRYEGVARRSQTYRKTIVDKVWNFFSSVKIGIWIIVLILLASALGTVFPQEMYIPPDAMASIYYEEEYGSIGKIYYTLGFHNLYSSWWYMLLVASLGVSLVICSLDRIVPLHRALRTQRVDRHERFLKSQRLFGKSEKIDQVEGEEELDLSEKILESKKYKVKRKNNSLLAEKGRFSRWGPYVNHIGLIIFLIGIMLRYFPEMYLYDHIWIREGQEVVVKGTDGEYFIRNDEFTMALYDDEDEQYTEALNRTGDQVAEYYQTSATLLRQANEGTIGVTTELEEVGQYDIRVNEPLSFEGYSLYQVDYKLNELSEFTFQLDSSEDYEGDLASVEFSVNLNNPDRMYEFDNGYVVEIIEYFPNFFINDDQEPDTLNRVPDNPRIIFEVYTPEMDPLEDSGEISIVGLQVNQGIHDFLLADDSVKEIQVNEEMNDLATMKIGGSVGEEEFVIIGVSVNDDITEGNEHTLRMVDYELNDVTALTISRDRTIPILILGGAIFMVGLTQGSYWHHRRIWIQLKDDELWIAGHANKNWHGLKKDLEALTKETKLPFPNDQVEEINEKSNNNDEKKE